MIIAMTGLLTLAPSLALLFVLGLFILAGLLESLRWAASGTRKILTRLVFQPLRWLVSGLTLAAVLAATPVWAGWLWGNAPDPKIEAANQALERAAQIATEAARTQSSQQETFLAAVEALANERAQLAGHLVYLGELSKRDSAWASALQTAGPMLVSVAVLGVAGAALWLTTRSSSDDAELASVLVEELAGTSPLLFSPGSLKSRIPGLGNAPPIGRQHLRHDDNPDPADCHFRSRYRPRSPNHHQKQNQNQNQYQYQHASPNPEEEMPF